MWVVSRRLMTNKIFVFNTLGTTITLFGFLGFATFLPKYFEYVFHQSASTSGYVGGLSATVGSALGVLITGPIIHKWKPHARKLAAWCVLMGLLGVACFIAIGNLKCKQTLFYGQSDLSSEFKYSGLACNADCNCNNVGYSPVCSEDGNINFFSACQAGCKSEPTLVKSANGKKTLKLYTECSCVKAYSKGLIFIFFPFDKQD